MKKLFLKDTIFLFGTFLLTALFVVIISQFGAQMTMPGLFLLFICYQIPWLLAVFLEGGLSFLKKEFLWNKKDQRLILLIVCFALIFYLVEGIFQNLSIDLSKLSFGFIQALLFGCLSEIGWRSYLQRHLEEHLGKKDALFIYFFIALIQTVWFVLLMNLAWHIQVSNLFVFFLFICGHGFCLGLISDASKTSIPVVFYHFLFQWISYALIIQFHLIPSLIIAALQIVLVLFIKKAF